MILTDSQKIQRRAHTDQKIANYGVPSHLLLMFIQERFVCMRLHYCNKDDKLTVNFSTAVKSSSRKTRALSNCCIVSLDNSIL